MDVDGAAESSQANYKDEIAEEDDWGQAGPPPLLIARGGPLYTLNLVSPFTRVPEYQDAILSELQSLKDELAFDSLQECNRDDIRVDDIKILSKEELVEMALKEVFKGEGENGSSSQPSEPNQNDDSYLAKVDEVLNVKHKQDEDKAAARLHSLSVGCKVKKSSIPFESDSVMKSLRSVNSNMQLVRSSDIRQQVPVQLPEVVLVVEVYHNVLQWQKTQEFLVLGRQLLTELKDKIHCKTDEIMRRAGCYDAAGYFLIEDVFYNDLREPYAVDYSEPIFDWLKNSIEEVNKKWESIISGDLKCKQKVVMSAMPTAIPEFRRAKMQTMRFCDLRFQLGAPYLYCHQGDCKHNVVIRDMRLIHPDDSQNRAAYPVLSFRLKIRQKKCSVCNIFRAKKVTVDDKWAKHNPCYFCDACYYLLHYSENRTLLYDDFSVYDYVDD